MFLENFKELENWKELVGYKLIERSAGEIMYLTTAYDTTPNKGTISIIKEKIECTLTEEELCTELDKILTSFHNDACEDDFIAIENAKIASFRKQHRALPNINYKNAMFYKGTTSYDAPVIVAEFEGKFGIFIHPNFQDYGFMILEKVNAA